MSNYFGRTMIWGDLWFRFQPDYIEVNTLPCYEPYMGTRMYFRFMDDAHMMDNLRAIISVFNMGWYDHDLELYWTSKRVRELDEKHEVIGNPDNYTVIPWVDKPEK